MAAAIFLLIVVVCTGIAEGGWIAVLFALEPAVHTLPSAFDLRVHQAFDPRIDRYMPPVVALSLFAGFPALLFHSQLSRTSTGFLLVGMLAMALAIIITQVSMRPINLELRTWQPDDPPANYHDRRSSWDRLHNIRTALGAIALICYSVSALAR